MAAFGAQNGAIIVPRPRGFPVYASIAQLAEHLLRKEKVSSSILDGGWATGSHGLVGYDARLTRERSRVRASVRILCPFSHKSRVTLHFGCVFAFFHAKKLKNAQFRGKNAPPKTHAKAYKFISCSLPEMPWAGIWPNFTQH